MDLPAARERYQGSELRLRTLLFGDAHYDMGRLKGEEPRTLAAAELRRMRVAFDDVLALARLERAADLDEDLHEEVVRSATDEPGSMVSGGQSTSKNTAETMSEELLAAARELAGASWTAIRPRVRGSDREKAVVRDRLLAEGRLVNTASRKGVFELSVRD